MTILKIAKVVSSIEFHLPSEKEKKEKFHRKSANLKGRVGAEMVFHETGNGKHEASRRFML